MSLQDIVDSITPFVVGCAITACVYNCALGKKMDTLEKDYSHKIFSMEMEMESMFRDSSGYRDEALINVYSGHEEGVFVPFNEYIKVKKNEFSST